MRSNPYMFEVSMEKTLVPIYADSFKDATNRFNKLIQPLFDIGGMTVQFKGKSKDDPEFVKVLKESYEYGEKYGDRNLMIDVEFELKKLNVI